MLTNIHGRGIIELLSLGASTVTQTLVQKTNPTAISFSDFDIDGLNVVTMKLSLATISPLGAGIKSKIAAANLRLVFTSVHGLDIFLDAPVDQTFDAVIPRRYLADPLNQTIDCLFRMAGHPPLQGQITVVP